MPDDTDGADGKPAAPSASRLSYLGRASHLGYLSRLSSYGGRDRMMARAGQMEYDRILFFSDAVFAIAITLLVIDLPGQIERASGSTGQSGALQAGTELRNAGSGIEGFAISFAVIGVFWMAHHSFYQHVKAIDRPLMILNLLFLGTIAFLPYPTELLSSVSNNQRPAVIFYAVCVGSAGLVETVAWSCRRQQGVRWARQQGAIWAAGLLAATTLAPALSGPLANCWNAALREL